MKTHHLPPPPPPNKKQTPPPLQRKECPASIMVTKGQQTWMITIVVHEHNHEISPTKSRLIRENRRLNLEVKRTFQINDETNVRLNNIFRSLVCDG